MLELDETKRRNLNFLDALRPVLNRYAALTNDTIHLAVLDGKDIVLLDRVFGDRQLRINSFPGLRNKALGYRSISTGSLRKLFFLCRGNRGSMKVAKPPGLQP
ncbi:hypothetical protein QBK99_03645 [Corticibacterium sp. UT-5YL-CI-8]|nr:hypothetical protein [Tianweitania sp. UT-5YL-CI-8]